MHSYDQAPTIEPPPSKVANDRRRPGRREVPPVLIRLLRSPSGGDLLDVGPDSLASEQDDDLAPARGLIIGVILSSALWAIAGLVASIWL